MKECLLFFCLVSTSLCGSDLPTANTSKEETTKPVIDEKIKNTSTVVGSPLSSGSVNSKNETTKVEKLEEDIIIKDEDIQRLISQTTLALSQNATETIDKINKGEDPFQNHINPELYVWIFDRNVKMVAHPSKLLVGASFKGIPDLKGYMWRDKIVEVALKSGKGVLEYYFQKPKEQPNQDKKDLVFKKKVFFSLVSGSNGEQYIVCSGRNEVIQGNKK